MLPLRNFHLKLFELCNFVLAWSLPLGTIYMFKEHMHKNRNAYFNPDLKACYVDNTAQLENNGYQAIHLNNFCKVSENSGALLLFKVDL